MCYEFGNLTVINCVICTDGPPHTLVPIYQNTRRREHNYEELSQLTAQHTRISGQNQNVVQ